MKHDNDNGLRFLSVCSGIEAASVAWNPLGWKAVAFSEIEPAPCSVLKHHYPDVPNLGDMTKFKEWPDYGKDGKQPIDLLCGGTPCQSFSVAGLRSGLADPRGNLALTFLAIADRYKPKWILWENVPGVLSSTSHVSADPREPQTPLDMGLDGQEVETDDEYDAEEVHAFNSFLAGLSELGYGWAYVVRDAQYVRVDGFARAVPQRRRRVFVVGYLGDWRRAAAVLLEPESMCGNSPPRRQAGENVAADVAPSLTASGRGVERSGETRGQDPVIAVAFGGNNTGGPIEVSTAVNAHAVPHGRLDFESETFMVTREVAATLTRGSENENGKGGYAGRRQEDDDNLVAHSLTAEGFDASEDGTGRGTPLVPVPYTLAIRGRGDSHNLEWRQDGTANAILTPNGGRAGIGVGAVAYNITPSNSNKDYNAREASYAQAVTTQSGAPSARGGDVLVETRPINTMVGLRHEALGEGTGLGIGNDGDPAYTITKAHHHAVQHGWAVRRLTPKECARLQGFPDDHLSQVIHNGKPLADGPMYKALGNSWPVNSVRWIGRRIQLVEDVSREIANDNQPTSLAA